MNETGTWRPLLTEDDEPELTRQVWEAVRAVGEALREPGEGEIPTAGGGQADEAVLAQLNGANLSTGNAGLSLFFTYLAQATQDDAWADLAAERIDRALAAVALHPIGAGFYGGFAGVAWVLQHLQGRLFEPGEGGDGEAAPGDTEEALLKLLEGDSWGSDYDLIGGLAGFGVYALEALPSAGARAVLERVLHHLEALARERPEGLTWHTAPQLLPPHQRQLYPDGYYNVGVAHGVPGIAGLLAGMAAAGIEPERTGRLLAGAVSWVLAQEGESEIGRCFPHFSAPGLPGGEGAGPGQASRLAWCYGDPGIAAVLLAAARAAGREDWEEHAVATALRSAARPLASSQVRDVGLCHGTAGLAHLLNRLHQATGRPELAAAARDWVRRTLEMRQPDGVAGFTCWDTAKGGWWPERGFLTGAAGVGLCLLGTVSPIEPAWDRAILTALSPKA